MQQREEEEGRTRYMEPVVEGEKKAAANGKRGIGKSRQGEEKKGEGLPSLSHFFDSLGREKGSERENRKNRTLLSLGFR